MKRIVKMLVTLAVTCAVSTCTCTSISAAVKKVTRPGCCLPGGQKK